MEDVKQPVTLTMEQLNGLLANMVGEISKAVGMDRVDRKHGIFPGQNEVEAEKMTKDQRLNLWLRTTLSKNPDPAAVAKVKTLYYATTAGLGFVPEEFRTEVIRVAELYGAVRRNAYVFPTSVAKINMHTLASSLTAYWITDQKTSITESEPVYAEPTIDVEKAATITAIANEMLQDATFPVVAHLAQLAGESLAYAEDVQGLTGTGSPFHGLIGGTISGQVTVTSSAQSYKNFSPEDLLDLAMGVAAKYRRGGAYFMHPTVLAALAKSFKTTTGDFILRTPREDGLATSIWGYPVIESEVITSTDAVATKFIGFANPKRLFFADRAQMEVATSDSATLATAGNSFQLDLTAVRVTERVGMAWTLGAGTAVLKTAAA